MADEITLNTLAKHYQHEEEAYKLVERLRWRNGPVCPHCGSIDHAYFLNPRDGARKTRTGSVSVRRVHKCGDCRRQFSVLQGSIFEGSKVPLSKWLLAFQMMCSDKNGTAAHELHRTLELDRKTAWFLAMRIRFAMQQEPLAGKLAGIVEVDKRPVVSLVQRGGEVRLRAMLTDEEIIEAVLQTRPMTPEERKALEEEYQNRKRTKPGRKKED